MSALSFNNYYCLSFFFVWNNVIQVVFQEMAVHGTLFSFINGDYKLGVAYPWLLFPVLVKTFNIT